MNYFSGDEILAFFNYVTRKKVIFAFVRYKNVQMLIAMAYDEKKRVAYLLQLEGKSPGLGERQRVQIF